MKFVLGKADLMSGKCTAAIERRQEKQFSVDTLQNKLKNVRPLSDCLKNINDMDAGFKQPLSRYAAKISANWQQHRTWVGRPVRAARWRTVSVCQRLHWPQG